MTSSDDPRKGVTDVKDRKTIIAGNWKMNKATGDAETLSSGIRAELADCTDVDVVLCPPFTALSTVAGTIAGTRIGLGAQNMHWESYGAYTGEVCAAMLCDVERRANVYCP